MTRLSVNVNKVATLRNSRGGQTPSVVEASRVIVGAGAGGLTVHPREDQRHITPADVRDVKAAFAGEWSDALEYNIEGDPRPDWMDLVCEVVPHQATLVPVTPGEVTSHAGWGPNESRSTLEAAIRRLKDAGIRVSLFVEARDEPIRWAAELGADRVELYTEPYARAFEKGPDAARRSLERYRHAAELSHELGLGVNAGHDLDLDNLPLFLEVPHVDEVSIGHALISRALFVGLETTVREYVEVLAGATG